MGVSWKRLIVGFYKPNVVNFFKFKGFNFVVVGGELKTGNFAGFFEREQVRGPGRGVIEVFPQE
jgi:hypothetical protein